MLPLAWLEAEHTHNYHWNCRQRTRPGYQQQSGLGCLVLLPLLLTSLTCAQAALAPMRPFLQLQNKATNFFEQAYQATYGPTAPGNVTETLQELETLLLWLAPANSSKGTRPTLTVPHIHEVHADKDGQELLQAAIQLSQHDLNASTMTAVLMQVGATLMHVSDTHGYPTFRRLIVGALIKRRALHGPFTQLPRLLADMVLLQFYLLHRRASASKGAVQYFHVSKSGGTNMCVTAESNGCTAEGFDESKNCKILDFVDWPRWLTQAGHEPISAGINATRANSSSATFKQPEEPPWFVNFEHEPQQMNCSQRAAYMQKRGYNFYAMEYLIPEGSPCHEFTQLMLWRHPIERMRSHVHFVQILYARAYALTEVQSLFEGRNSSFWRTFLPVGTDNQYIRSLLGLQHWQLPLKPITQQQVHAAMAQVIQQDLLITLEQRAFSDVACHQGLGWPSPLRNHKIRSSSSFRVRQFLPPDWDTLCQLNQPDVQVYNFASQLAAIDAVVWHSAQLMRKELELDLSLPTNLQCGYVSLPLHMIMASPKPPASPVVPDSKPQSTRPSPAPSSPSVAMSGTITKTTSSPSTAVSGTSHKITSSPSSNRSPATSLTSLITDVTQFTAPSFDSTAYSSFAEDMAALMSAGGYPLGVAPVSTAGERPLPLTPRPSPGPSLSSPVYLPRSSPSLVSNSSPSPAATTAKSVTAIGTSPAATPTKPEQVTGSSESSKTMSLPALVKPAAGAANKTASAAHRRHKHSARRVYRILHR